MSWFEYGVPKKRGDRRNVCLRIRHLPNNLKEIANKGMRPKEILDYVKVYRIRPAGKVLLKFASFNPDDSINADLSPIEQRLTVFYAEAEENPDWICETDVGRGFKE